MLKFPSGERLLGIDDNPDICLIVRYSGEDLGSWQVVSTNLSLALSQARRGQWDGILLEMATDQHRDFCLYNRLQRHVVTRIIPIVLLTSRVMVVNDLSRSQQMAMAGIIPRPFDPINLAQPNCPDAGVDRGTGEAGLPGIRNGMGHHS